MRKINVLFLIEHVARELDVITCLVQKLRTQFGIDAEVKSYYNDFTYNLETYRPEIVVFPFFYGADNPYAIEYLARWPETKFLNLAWEQILMEVDYGMKTPRDDSARERVMHICWTQKYFDFLLSKGAKPDHLLLTGNPVMKLYDSPYKNYFKSRADLASLYKIDAGRKWVLFPESYQYVFMSEHRLQELVEEDNADPKLLAEAREYSNRCLNLLFAWANELCAKTDPLFILRPRPSTTPERAMKFMRKAIGAPAGNIAIIKAESAREWILAADHVVSSHSTTLIEAAIAGKPVHLFSPEAIPDALTAEWHDLIPLLKNRDSFLQAIRQFPIEPNGTQLASWARARQFPEHDPLDAIARRIAQLSAPTRLHEPSPLSDYSRLWNGRILLEMLRRWWRRFISREDIFGTREVARRVSRWRRVLEASSRTPT
jgi:surface carbohydrate biosynthesis protein